MELLFSRSEVGTTQGKTLAGRVGLGITGKEEGPRAVHEVLSQGGRRKMGTGGDRGHLADFAWRAFTLARLPPEPF